MAEQQNSSNINQNTNQAIYGLNTDSILQQVKPGTLTYALNAQVDSFDGDMITYQNEQSNVLCSEFKPGYKVIGHHSIIEQDKIILFLTNPSTGNSEIGQLISVASCDINNPTNLNKVKTNQYVNNGYNSIDPSCACTNSDENQEEILSFYELYKKLNSDKLPPEINSCCTYTTLVQGPCLNFNINYPIHKVVHRIVDRNDDGNCGTEIYWTDGLNGRRFMNLDDLPFSENIINCERVKSDVLDCDLLEVQPTLTIPCITPQVVGDGGSLIEGVYQFGIRYGNEKGEPYTAVYGITNEIGIFEDTYGFNFNSPTNKSIKILVNNLDTKFNYFDLIVIKTINGVADVELVGTYEITKSDMEITYTGNNKTPIKLTINDVFQRYPFYGNAANVESTGDLLLWSNLKGRERVNYQSIANNIDLEWVTYQIPYSDRLQDGYHNGVYTALFRGYMRDEVYPFEFQPILKRGEVEDGFHIPGRVATEEDLEIISSEDNDDVVLDPLCVNSENTKKRWQVYNTGSVTAQDPAYIAAPDKNCYIGPYEYGKFGYWESEKKYPCNTKVWGALADTPIRHHKFPDNIITHIYNKNPNPQDKEFEHKIYPIGIRVNLENIRQAIINSDLTQEQKDNIIGFKIIRGDRVNNKSVIAKGLLYNVGAYIPYSEGTTPAENQQVFYPNYPFNDLGDDPYLTNLSAVGDGGFNIFLLDSISGAIDNEQQQLDTLLSLMPTIPAISFTLNGGPPTVIPPNPIIIEITNSEKNDLQNKIYAAQQAGQNLLDEIAEIQAYYDQKIQDGEPICEDDVASMTINPALITAYENALTAINTSGAMSNFQDIVDYVNTNEATLNSHPDANDDPSTGSPGIFTVKTRLVDVLKVNTNIDNGIDALQDSIDDYNDALVELATVECTGETVSESIFSRSRFTFHSPDTHFFKPLLGDRLKLEVDESGISIGNFVQVKNHAGHKMMSAFSSGIALAAGILVGALFAAEPRQYVVGSSPGPRITFYAPAMPSLGTIAEKALYWNQQFKTLIDNLLPYKNYAYQYNAIGIYNTYEPIPNDQGIKIRGLDKAYYLLPGQQAIGDIYPVNNWKRESSVYFRTDQLVTPLLYPNDPIILGSLEEDNSRVSYSADRQIYSNVLSYYASNKRNVPDQYGDIYSYQTVDTGYCGKIDLANEYIDSREDIFGGDIFINRFGLKRKLSFFIDTAVDKPDGTDISYSDLSNIGRVRYWYNTSSAQTPSSGFKGLMKSILNVPQSNFDGNSNKLFYQNGRIYLYSYGIAYFFVESEVNVDFRQASNNTSHDFYPNIGSGIPNDWLQETNVPIIHDNYYIYNKTYSKQNKESLVTHLPLTFDPNNECFDDYSNRVIYSDLNKWRIYKPISYFDFPKSHGKLTSIDTIDNTQILVRFENKTYLYNALTAIQTTSGKNAYLGNDDVFKAQPIDFGETDLGYAGSQHHFLLKTEAGHLFIDAVRASIFLLGPNARGGIQAIPISDQGMSKWFDKNLPFNISRYFPTINIDNHFNGIGITGTWDNKYGRFIITKLDYIPKDEVKDDIRYDSNTGKFYYKNNEIILNDSRYFCNKSWTISYNPDTKSWISFHSYIPNYFIPNNGFFITGKNPNFANEKASSWLHGLVTTSYQRFYGKLEPYILEYPFSFKANDEIAQNIKDHTTILEYYNENDYYEINEGVYFNKAILYNGQQTSGILNLYPKPKGKLNLYFQYPKYNKDSKDIIYTKSDNFFNYNTFWDVVKNPNNHFPIWIETCENKSVDKVLNNDKLDYSSRSHQKTKLRAKDLKIRHINDIFDRYKFISKFINVSTQVSYK